MCHFSLRIFSENAQVAYERPYGINRLMEAKHAVKRQIDIKTILPLPANYRCGLNLGKIYIVKRQYGQYLGKRALGVGKRKYD